MIDFSENSDDFSDQGATMGEIWNDYYLNYIPEMVRLVIPVAVFSACLFLTGQLSERMEITALKAAGVSLYRLVVPYMVFAVLVAVTISTLDAYVIPNSNRIKIKFEDKYIKRKNEKIDRSDIYRQPSKNQVLRVNFFDVSNNTAFRINLIEFDSLKVRRTTSANKMEWKDDKQIWQLTNVKQHVYTDSGFTETKINKLDTVLTVYPKDLARTTSDIYQLTYPDARQYIASIERSGAGGVNIPKVQFYGRLAYPLSILIVIIVGFAVASERREGGKSIYIAAGLSISFLYLAFMKIIEPFGYYGTISPELAATLPHVFFFIVGIFLLIQTKK